jgi:hypothetical protein
MNDNIKAGADHHAGDGGYSIGTQERYEEFVKLRNRVPNERIRELEKQCWSHHINGALVDGHLHFDTKKFAELIIQECCSAIRLNDVFFGGKFQGAILKHFGVEE